MNGDGQPAVVCFSHRRWDFLYQRPQHLMTRFARERRVLFVEEPLYDAGPPRIAITCTDGVQVVVPHLRQGTSPARAVWLQRLLIDAMLRHQSLDGFIAWYYTPMALELTPQLTPRACVYDCTDELSARAGAPPRLGALETALLERAEVVFTGGHSLYEHKRHLHRNMHPMPSSVDVAHFAGARHLAGEPDDQARIPHPRLGYCGVVDERFDHALVGELARRRPDWHVVIVGPVVDLDAARLPRARNIHYLGRKRYAELPRYLAGWDVALLPLALNDATRFVSPTQTLEYLAAGKRVVATPIRDVVRPYGEQGLVTIAAGAERFAAAVAECLARDDHEAHRRAVDAHLADRSWDATFRRMRQRVEDVVEWRRQTEAAACSTSP